MSNDSVKNFWDSFSAYYYENIKYVNNILIY